jgi:Sulfotransferase family
MRVTKERRSRFSMSSEFRCRQYIVLCGILFVLGCSRSSFNVDPIDQQQNEHGEYTRELQRFQSVYPLKSRRTQNPNGGAFVHTGKTGGSTISVLLRNGCHSFMPHPCRANITHESATSKLVQSYYHVPDFGLLQESNHSFYIITSRDPFDRTVSAFVYDHVKNRYARNESVSEYKKSKYEEAYRCFPSLSQYVENLGDKPHEFNYPHKRNWVNAESCSDLAKAALHSRVKIYNHLYFSMFFILSNIPTLEKQTIYTIRQEYLWDDWKGLNMALGQTEPVHVPHDGMDILRNVTILEMEKKMPITRELSQYGRTILCNALRHEYQAYYYILIKAKNLSPTDLEQSISRTKQNCPNLALPYSTYTK